MLNSRPSVTAPYKADMVTFVRDNYHVVMYVGLTASLDLMLCGQWTVIRPTHV